jgi:hypothetical protein
MLKITIDDTQFNKDMRNVIQYSLGFFEGVKQGVPDFLRGTGASVVESLKQYIDANARVSPQLLHHVYEWSQSGSPNARLFDIDFIVSGDRVSFVSSFRQSSSIQKGSSTPFVDKARVMEAGIPVTIVPKRRVLAFQDDSGEQVFTSNPVTVANPGGNVSGEYERTFRSFFNSYFAQSYLQSAGILTYLRNPAAFDLGLSKRGGRSKGVAVGRNWIAKAGDL